MIEAEKIIKILKKNKINFYTGIPDSILKNLSKALSGYNKNNHIIATNEGSAVSLGIGYHLSTKKIPAIYLQNSGLGNIVNPIVSIAHKKVYSVPMLLIIGWRGSPNLIDEVQHKVQGTITQELLKKGFLASNTVYSSISHKRYIVDKYLEELEKVFLKIQQVIELRHVKQIEYLNALLSIHTSKIGYV